MSNVCKLNYHFQFVVIVCISSDLSRINFNTAAVRDVVIPVLVALDAATLQFGLRFVPSARVLTTSTVVGDGRVHLSLQSREHLDPEHEQKDPAHQHHHEDYEH